MYVTTFGEAESVASETSDQPMLLTFGLVSIQQTDNS